MANFVIKKDGTRVPFDSEKIKASIVSAALEAELSDDQAANTAEETSNLVSASFEGQEEVATSDIRAKILSELDVSAPAVAESWRKYEEGKNG